MSDLPVNYLDDILAQSMNGKRKYRITRADGTFEEVTLEDVSEYERVGSNFGAGDINKTNQAVNEKLDSDDVVDPMETTVPGFAADALAVKNQFDEQNKNFEWKFFKELTDINQTSTLPTNFNELLIEIVADTYLWVFNIHILKNQLLSGNKRNFFNGFHNGKLYICAGAMVSLEEITGYLEGTVTVGSLKIYYR